MKRPVQSLLLACIRAYHRMPLPTHSLCKYYPTCSYYVEEAIERFGAGKGLLLALWRFLRCNPFSKGGFDPVPEKKPRNGEKK